MEYCNQNDLTGAFSSFISDLGKHEETKDHLVIKMGMMLMLSNNLSTQSEMKRFIEGTN